MLDYVLSKARELPSIKGRQRVYSAIYDKRGRLVSESACSYEKTHPMQKRLSLNEGFDAERCYLHSEVAAIIKSRGRGYKIVVARVGRKGRVLDAKPCPSCMRAIREASWIKSIEYTLEDRNIQLD